MSKSFSKTYFLIPLVYLGVIFLLLFLQFSGGRRFQESVGDLMLRGTLEGRELTAPIGEARLDYEGLRFSFESGSFPMLAADPDDPGGSGQELRLEEYRSLERGFSFAFSAETGEELLLDFTLGAEDDLLIQAIIPDSLTDVGSLLLPFSVAPGASTAAEQSGDVLSIDQSGERHFLTLPPRGRAYTDDMRLALDTSVQSQIVRYMRASDSTQDVVAVWFQDGELEVPDSNFEQRITSYINVAYTGWSTTRYNGGSGTWAFRDGTRGFDERILTAYLAEAWRREGEYRRAFGEMRRAADLHSQDVGLLSSAYLGSLDDVRRRFLASDRIENERLLSLVRDENPTIFLTPELIQFAADRGSPELLSELLALVPEIDFRSVDMTTAVGMLHNYLMPGDAPSDLVDNLQPFMGIIEARILPSIVRVDSRYFLQSVPGQVDLYYSIVAGMLLDRAADQTGNQVLEDVGRNLVLSALELADEDGFLPATLLTNNLNMQGSEGSFGPEDIYTVLTDNPAYPQQISLYEQLGQGRWIWTVANFENISITPSEYRSTLSYPRERTHYIIMQGIEPFTSMQLFSFFPWRSDPAFEAYQKGRHYIEDTRTLMIKYTDNSVRENIIIYP